MNRPKGFIEMIRPSKTLIIVSDVVTHPVEENTRLGILTRTGSTQTDGGSNSQRISTLLRLGVLAEFQVPGLGSMALEPMTYDLTRLAAAQLLDHCVVETERLQVVEDAILFRFPELM